MEAIFATVDDALGALDHDAFQEVIRLITEPLGPTLFLYDLSSRRHARELRHTAAKRQRVLPRPCASS